MPTVPPEFVKLVRANYASITANNPSLSPLYLWAGGYRVALHTVRIDWRLQIPFTPPNIRVVTWPDQLRGLRGKGRILWRCCGADDAEIEYTALQRGFEILPSEEFFEWLLKHMRG